jgi:protein SCO1
MAFMKTLIGSVILSSIVISAANAQYFRKPESDLDPKIMQIDEKAFLGAKLEGATPLVGTDGKTFPLSDQLGKPLILVLSYYTCDGSCSVINNELLSLLDEVKSVKAGEDYRILTLSFDKHDNLETTGAFKSHLNNSAAYGDNWTFATFKNEEDLRAQTAKIGFRFFWSPEDRFFIHPGAFLFFSPEGRLIRILYPESLEGSDIELAVLDAKQGQFRPQEIINFAVSLCYSYNYEEGKYTLSIPIFVGVGALLLGITILLVSITYFKRKNFRYSGSVDNAHIT